MADIVGTVGNDTLNGTGDADNITALAGNDTVNAGAGNDIINGGLGNDTLFGEDGDDTFIEDTITSSLDVFNGGSGFDTVELRAVSNAIITAIGPVSPHSFSNAASLVSIERLLYASQAGQVVQAQMLIGSFAGSGLTQIVGGAGRDIFTLQTGPTGGTFTMLNLPISNWDAPSVNAWEHAGDYVVLSGATLGAGNTATLNALAGANFMQFLSGGAGNDTVNGSDSADIIDASRGGDTVNAGGGNDSIQIINTAAPVNGNSWGPQSTFTGAGGVWDGGAGTDVISIGGTVILQSILLNIEGVYLQAAFTPPAFNTTIQYAAQLSLDSAHIAMLPGNAFFSGTGTIVFEIDDGLSFNASTYVVTAGSEVDFIINAGSGNGLIYTGSARDDEINLVTGTQTALGGDGSDIIRYGSGVQTLSGDAGDDAIVIGGAVTAGSTFDGGSDTDVLVLQRFNGASFNGPPSQILALRTLPGNGVVNIEAVSFASEIGFGMQGIFDHDAGFATAIGGNGSDNLVYVVSGSGVYSMPNVTLQNWGTGDILSLAVLAGDTGSYTLNGRNDIGQILQGRSGNDTLNGGALNDRLLGGGGADILNGNGGDDYIALQNGWNGATVNGGSGTDTLAITGTVSSLAGLLDMEAITFISGGALTLTANQWTNGLAFNTVLNGAGAVIVNLAPFDEFAPTAATLAGGSAVSFTVNGSTDTDVIKAALGIASTIIGNDGADQLRGSNLIDTIDGGDGNDKIMGLGGADVITSGAGSDQIRLYSASDSGLGAAADRLIDFAIGQDILNFVLLDADAATPGDQEFSFIGTAAFSNNGLGQIRFLTAGADLIVQADSDGNGVADMEIVLQGLGGSILTTNDFIL